MKRSGASGRTVETHRDIGLGTTGPRLLAPPGPLKALAHTGPTMEKWLMKLVKQAKTQWKQAATQWKQVKQVAAQWKQATIQ